MPNSLVQARIDSDIKNRAAEVLESLGLTLSDAVRMLLTRVAKEGGLPAGLTMDSIAHDKWFREQVQKAIDDPRPSVPNEQAEAYFATKKAKLRQS